MIAVGNLAVGGMGKTPMTEYLIRLLRREFKVATLSRGYRRKTRGFRIAGDADTPFTLGDEPIQFRNKYDAITVAVDEHRRRGIHQLLKNDPGLQVILLDDALQHRYVKAGFTILVTDYQKLFTKDFLLPVGRLREPASSQRRADIIVVTKTPRVFSPLVRRQLLEDLKADNRMTVCFAYLAYDSLVPVFSPEGDLKTNTEDLYYILMVTGIVNPYPMKEHLRSKCSEIESLEFPDHTFYDEKRLQQIVATFDKFPSKRKAIVTTEKDASKLKTSQGKKYLGGLPVYFLPMRMEFHAKDKVVFDTKIQQFMNSFYPAKLKQQSTTEI